MTSSRWAELQRVFDQALERTPERRLAFVAQACGDDLELRKEVLELLQADQAAGPFLVTAPDAERQVLDAELIGRTVGPYTILAEIGRGGMGAVYRARRNDESYLKDVALKLVPGGLGSALFVGRFRQERRILGRLDHPSIARLLDGGTTEQGQPYFAMEYVKGQPLDAYCAERGLDLRRRLELFRAVCGAVAYAHRNLVVHRDLKPSNILVTADGLPKLLDFGIAKLLAPDDSSAPEPTLTGMQVMTPEYASPEQVVGGPVTTAADVYSLGVLLYQLLTGRRPYELSTRNPAEIARVICHEEPRPPSAAVGRIARESAASPPAIGGPARLEATRIRRALVGDLDTIVMKALRKEAERRYASVGELSEDLRRYLAGLPVLARKDTLRYRTGKFVRRHHAAVAAAALVALALLGGLLTTARQARIAERNRARAVHRSQDAQRLANSLVFELHDAIADLPGATTARALLLRRASEMLDTLGADSPDDAALEEDLAAAYHKLGDVLGGGAETSTLGQKDAALTAHHKGLAIRERLAVAAPDDAARQARLASSHIEISYLAEGSDALGHARAAAAIASRLAAQAPADPGYQNLLAKALYAQGSAEVGGGDLRGATVSFGKALAAFELLATRAPANASARRSVVLTHKRLGAILAKEGRQADALVHYREVVASEEARVASDPRSVEARRDLSVSLVDLGLTLGAGGDHRSEVALGRRAVAIREQLVRADPANAQAKVDLASALAKLCHAFQGSGDDREALSHCERAEAALGPAPARQDLLADISLGKSLAYGGLGRWAEALRTARTAEQIGRTLLARQPHNTWRRIGVAHALLNVGDALVGLSTGPGASARRSAERLAEAARSYREALSLTDDVRATGRLVGADAKLPDRARAGAARCEKDLAAKRRPRRDPDYGMGQPGSVPQSTR